MVMEGVGPYVAHALGAFLDGTPGPLADANLTRVFARFFLGWRESPPDERVKRWSAERSADLASTLPTTEVPLFYWGLLDFAAAVCRAKAPRCLTCPLLADCLYGQTEIQSGTQGN